MKGQLDRWKLITDGTEITIEPQMKELQGWILEKTAELQAKINNAEMAILLQNFTDNMLVEFKNQIQAEMRRRKNERFSL